jgi:ferritin-like metal-binding protein YciE
MNSLKELLAVQIQDLYDAEKQLVKALPKMAKAAQSEELRSGFEEHLEATKGHVTRLEQVFQSLDAKPKTKSCEAMKGLVAESQETIDGHESSDVRDIALIGAVKKVEHYEMAAYQTAIKLAETVGDDTASELLGETLSEEEETDQKLNDMCDQIVERSTAEGTKVPATEEEDEKEYSEPPRATASTKTRKAG